MSYEIFEEGASFPRAGVWPSVALAFSLSGCGAIPLVMEQFSPPPPPPPASPELKAEFLKSCGIYYDPAIRIIKEFSLVPAEGRDFLVRSLEALGTRTDVPENIADTAHCPLLAEALDGSFTSARAALDIVFSDGISRASRQLVPKNRVWVHPAIQGTGTDPADIVSPEFDSVSLREAEWHGERVFVLEIKKFTTRTAEEARAHLLTLPRSPDTVLILDLRDNFGGHISSYEQVASLFVPWGTELYTTQGRNGETKTYRTHSDPAFSGNLSMTIINENTYSGGLMLAATLRPHGVPIVTSSPDAHSHNQYKLEAFPLSEENPHYTLLLTTDKIFPNGEDKETLTVDFKVPHDFQPFSYGSVSSSNPPAFRY